MKTHQFSSFAILLVALLCSCAMFIFHSPVDKAYADGDAVVVIEDANGDKTEYTSWNDALSAWRNGETLQLRSDITSPSAIEVSGQKTLDLNGHVLSCTAGRTVWVEGTLTVTDSRSLGGAISGGGVRVYGGGSLILQSGTIRDNSNADGGGVLVDAGATFTMNGGAIVQNRATEGNGGGVYLAAGATFTMNGGSITDNTAARLGGGIYGVGTMTFSGGASVFENNGDNLYLPDGVTVRADALTGKIGVTTAGGAVTFASGDGSGFVADDPTYVVKSGGESVRLAYSPLVGITVSFDGTVVYPTTQAEALLPHITVTGVNENGVPYPDQALRRVTVAYAEGVDGFTVGKNDLTVTATGEDGEQVSTVFTIDAVAPQLTALSAVFGQSEEVIYFDTPLENLDALLTVKGTYSDGFERVLLTTAEETAERNGEAYIRDFYRLSGDLNQRTDGVASLTVSAQGLTAKVSVVVSKYVLDVAAIKPNNVMVVQNANDWTLDAYLFFSQSLPAGIKPIVTIGDGLKESELLAGIYPVTISFAVQDANNYAVEGESVTATLIVNHASLTFSDEDGEFCSVTRDGGIPLDWELTVRDVTGTVSAPRLSDGDWEAKQIVELSLRDDGSIVTQIDGGVTVRLVLSERLRDEEVRLYRVLSDGKVIEVETERDGD